MLATPDLETTPEVSALADAVTTVLDTDLTHGPFGWTTITDPTTGRTWIKPKALDPTQPPKSITATTPTNSSTAPAANRKTTPATTSRNAGSRHRTRLGQRHDDREDPVPHPAPPARDRSPATDRRNRR